MLKDVAIQIFAITVGSFIIAGYLTWQILQLGVRCLESFSRVQKLSVFIYILMMLKQISL